MNEIPETCPTCDAAPAQNPARDRLRRQGILTEELSFTVFQCGSIHGVVAGMKVVGFAGCQESSRSDELEWDDLDREGYELRRAREGWWLAEKGKGTLLIIPVTHEWTAREHVVAVINALRAIEKVAT